MPKYAKGVVDARTMAKAKYGELEQMVGLSYNPHGLVASDRLMDHVHLLQAVTYDWVHNMCASILDGIYTCYTDFSNIGLKGKL